MFVFCYFAAPLITWTLVPAGPPTLGWQRYAPESETLARWISRKEAVVSPFSVIWLTPPRGESYEMAWGTYAVKLLWSIFQPYHCVSRRYTAEVPGCRAPCR